MDFVVGDVVRQGFGFANPNHAAAEYDKRGQLVAVKEGGSDLERYVYDKAGNMIMKVVRGSRFVVRDGVECAVRDGEYKTTTFTSTTRTSSSRLRPTA